MRDATSFAIGLMEFATYVSAGNLTGNTIHTPDLDS